MYPIKKREVIRIYPIKRISKPNCPHCNLPLEMNESELLKLVSSTNPNDSILHCPNCGGKFRVTCDIIFNGVIVG